MYRIHPPDNRNSSGEYPASYPGNIPAASGDTDSSNGNTSNKNEEDEFMDIQKELEAKFDELFGPMDDEDNNPTDSE